MLNTKDLSKVQLVESDYHNKNNDYNKMHTFCLTCHNRPCACRSPRKFKMTDDSLKNVGINSGKILTCYEDFDPIKDEGCLFIVSLSGGAMVARFVEIYDNAEFMLYAANETIPDVIAFADHTDIVGIVTPKIRRPNSFTWGCLFIDRQELIVL